MRFTIYQAPFEQTSRGYDPNADYGKVWEGELDESLHRRRADWPTADGSDLLESIFQDFQRVDPGSHWPPEGYEGRSLSVGDVVVLDGWAAYSVEVQGFSTAKGFLQPAVGRQT